MKKSIGKKSMALFIVMSMICSLFVMGASAEEEKKTVSVLVRIEAGDKTLVYPTRVKVDNFSLASFGAKTEKNAPTALHALIKALDLDEVGPDSSLSVDADSGYIKKIDTYQTDDYRSWMYAVNDQLPDVGCSNYELKDDDQIVFYYSNTEIGSYAYFIEQTKTVAAGESFGMILNSVFFDNDAKYTGPVENAEILVSKAGEQDATIKTGIKTDVLGSCKLTFDEPGTYVVSAERYGYKYADTSNISRARSVITVTGKATQSTVQPSITAGEGGTATLGSDHKTISIKPQEGYQIKDVTVNGTSVGAVESYVLKDSEKDAKVIASFEKKVTTEPSTPAVPSAGFTDIAHHWAKDAIEYAVANGLFSGTTDTTFSPDSAMTRGMFVTVLGRYAKVNNVSGATDFSDVPEDAYYAPYVAWASQNGIVSGLDAKTFAPNAPVTREQMAVLMQKFIEYKMGSEVEIGGMILREFDDFDQISSWAADALTYCADNGLISGKGNQRLDPKGTATRAEVATVMQKLIALLN